MRTINTISLLAHDYDEAIEFYTEKPGFRLFNEAPREEAYGIVAVLLDLYGNLWDLIQHH